MSDAAHLTSLDFHLQTSQGQALCLELCGPSIVFCIRNVPYKCSLRCKALRDLSAFLHFNPSHLFFLTSQGYCEQIKIQHLKSLCIHATVFGKWQLLRSLSGTLYMPQKYSLVCWAVGTCLHKLQMSWGQALCTCTLCSQHSAHLIAGPEASCMTEQPSSSPVELPQLRESP